MASITIRDVAKVAGVGVGTVSRVLNGSTAVRETTRQKVLAAIEELGYSPNLTARRLSLGKTMTIGVIAPFFTKPSYVERLRGVESILAVTDYDIILFNVETVERKKKIFQEIAGQERVDGLLVMSISPNDEEEARLRQASITTVLIDAYHPDLTHVVIENFAGGYQATSHLIELGHQRIGYISHYLENPMYFTPVRDRLLGYQQALSEAGIAFRPEYHLEGANGRGEARRMAQEMLTLPEPPTAIFAFSDTQAIGVLQAANDLNLTVPDDLSVIGFDDIEAAEYLQLTTVHQPLFKSGVLGTQKLLEQIASGQELSEEIFLPTQIIMRNTTGLAPNQLR